TDPAIADVLNKTVLVGITRLDNAGKPTGQEQYRGRVLRVNRTEGIVLQTPSGQLQTLPPDLAYLSVARPGAYRLRSTGEVVPDPDSTTAGTWRPPPTSPPAADA